MSSFAPLTAAAGGALIGTAAAVMMLLRHKVLGASGIARDVLHATNAAYPDGYAVVAGTLTAGAAFGQYLAPALFELAPPPTPTLPLAGLCVGLGANLANGCTSGHGLCGLSRLSYRSFVAVPTFMASAVLTVQLTAAGQTAPIGILPLVETPQVASLALRTSIALACALPPVAFLPKAAKEVYVPYWVGVCFGSGLAIGGMVRPSVVKGAFGLRAFDPTLWILFATAAAFTFVGYRVACVSGNNDTACAKAGGVVDAKLVLGSILFGIGWGLGGICPGPFMTAAAGSPSAAMAVFGVALAAGIYLADPLVGALGMGAPSRKKPRGSEVLM